MTGVATKSQVAENKLKSNMTYKELFESLNELSAEQLNQTVTVYNAADDEPGYSVNGTDASYVNSLYQGYKDGINTPLPEPTTFDLLDPLTADPHYRPKYTPLPGQRYSDLYNKF